MGVKGLQYYLEQCCQSASPFVSIQELAMRKRRNSEELVIVVDGSGCINRLYGDLEWIGGGQLKQFGEKAKCLVQAFASIGVRLVFFFDGPTVPRKRKTWVERRMSKLESMYFVLDTIASEMPSSSIAKKHFHLPPSLGQLSRFVFEIICGCEVFQSLDECDEEIAEYARSHEVFAILGQDTDYVILDIGNALYLSMENLDLKNMTTRLYDRYELARSLRMDPSQLPLLATLMGNDIIAADELKRFHLYITRRNFSNTRVDFRSLVPTLASYIQTLPYERDRLLNVLPALSQKILGHPDGTRDILDSLRSYDSLPSKDYDRQEAAFNDHWSRLVAEARRRHQNNKIIGMVYAVMRGLPFESGVSIEDFRKTDLPCFARATQTIRQRIYGILLQEKPLPHSGQHLVAEWCMAGPGSLDNANYVPVIPPPYEHPGLMALWNDEGQLHVRWQLFVHSISPELDTNRIRSTLPAYLVVPTLILYYINKMGCLSPWEVDAMLATATTLKYYDTGRLAAVPPDPMSTRGIRVANLIMRSTFVLYFLLAACGYPLGIEDTAPWLFFDGKLFQAKYKQAERRSTTHSQLCEHKVDVLEEFQTARSLIFNHVQ